MIFFSQFLLDDALSTWLRDESIQLENERTGATVATLIASTLWQYIPHHKRRSWSLSSRAQEMKCHSPYKISSEPHPHRQNWFSNLIRCLLLSSAALTFKFQKDGKSYSHTQISDSSQRVMAHVEQFLWLNRQPSQRLGKFQSFHFTELFPSSFPRPIETGASCPVLILLIVYSNVIAHIRWKKKRNWEMRKILPLCAVTARGAVNSISSYPSVAAFFTKELQYVVIARIVVCL